MRQYTTTVFTHSPQHSQSNVSETHTHTHTSWNVSENKQVPVVVKCLQAYLSVWFHFFPLTAHTHTHTKRKLSTNVGANGYLRVFWDLCYVPVADDITAWSDFSRKEHITDQEVKHIERH